MNEEIKSVNDVPMLRAVDLTKRYEDGILALDHVNFEVKPGQIFTLLGANGAGKTTTINLFLNFIDPTDGYAEADSIRSDRAPLEAKKKLAYVSENVMLYPGFTAIQNLDFFSRLAGQNQYTTADYCRVLKRVGLDEAWYSRKLKTFSKGMRQKCGIAIAILKDAAAILLDEPTSGLDPKAGHEFIRLLEALRDEGKAILMSTHDVFRAKAVSDVVGIMNRGCLVMLRSRSELLHENLESLYLEFMTGLEST